MTKKKAEPDSKKDPKRKKKKVEVRLDEDLHKQTKDYARQNGVSVGALIRSLLGFWTDPRDPRPLPPNVDKQKQRPPRAKQKRRGKKGKGGKE